MVKNGQKICPLSALSIPIIIVTNHYKALWAGNGGRSGLGEARQMSLEVALRMQGVDGGISFTSQLEHCVKSPRMKQLCHL